MYACVCVCMSYVDPNPRRPSLLSQLDSISFFSSFSFSSVPFSACLPQENFIFAVVQTFVTTKSGMDRACRQCCKMIPLGGCAINQSLTALGTESFAACLIGRAVLGRYLCRHARLEAPRRLVEMLATSSCWGRSLYSCQRVKLL